MKRGIIFLIMILAAATGSSQVKTPENALAYKPGEELVLIVSYRAKLWPNTDMGDVTMSVSEDRINSIPSLRIDAYAKVFGAFRWFYKLDDRYSSWICAETHKPLKSTADLREGNYRFSSTFNYDWNSNTSFNRWRRHTWANDKTKVVDLKDGAMDAMSAFYTLRSEDMSGFKEGESRIITLLLEDTVRHIEYKYLGREVMDVPKLGKVRTLKFSCQLATSQGESFEDGSEFYLWVTDDPNKVPVYMESPIRVGSIRVRLDSYKGLKDPVNSVLK